MNANVDLTANLHEDVLRSIMSHIHSLPDRYKLAAVNKKFRRCVLEQQPYKQIPLEINFLRKYLNGHNVPIEDWPHAVQVLAPKTRFTQIRVVDGGCGYEAGVLDRIFSILACSGCLAQVSTFESSKSCNPSALSELLGHCPNLTALGLRFISRTLLDINKPFTQHSEPFEYNQQDLINLFRFVKPNMLQRLVLTFTDLNSLNLAELVNNSKAVLCRLREMRLCYEYSAMQLEQLGTVLPHLPLLQSCTIDCDPDYTSHQEFATGLAALFNNSKRQQPLAVQCRFSSHKGLAGCGVFILIGPLKQAHPDIQVDFDKHNMRFELENVSYAAPMYRKPCDQACLQCHFMYPVVVKELLFEARLRNSEHLDNYRLDRCKANKIVLDLEEKLPNAGIHCEFATINETGDIVVITFEDDDGDQFYITIDCGHCLSDGCIGCLVI